MALHKRNALNNVNETWQQNEKRRDDGPGTGRMDNAAPVSDDLQQTIREEAAEYDEANKEDRLLGGERATLNDE